MTFVRFERGIRGAVEATPAAWGVLTDDGETVRELRAAPYGGIIESGQTYPIDEVRLLAPATPANYRDIAGPNARLSLPPYVDSFSYQVGFALVIGNQAAATGPARRHHEVFGYTCFVRVRASLTADDIEQQPRNVVLADRLVLGPVLIAGSIAPKAHLHLTLNGEATVCSPDIAASIADALSRSLAEDSLMPGDLILVEADPASAPSMVPGDVLTVEVSGIGRLVTLCSR